MICSITFGKQNDLVKRYHSIFEHVRSPLDNVGISKVTSGLWQCNFKLLSFVDQNVLHSGCVQQNGRPTEVSVTFREVIASFSVVSTNIRSCDIVLLCFLCLSAGLLRKSEYSTTQVSTIYIYSRAGQNSCDAVAH